MCPVLMLAAMLAATLAGCSQPGELATRRPLLDPAAGAGAPPFRSGVWRRIWPDAAENPCPLDGARPVRAWPACAAPEWVAPDRMVAIAFVKTPLGSMPIGRSHPYSLAAGSPLVMQSYGEAYVGRYNYDAVDEVELDAAGRIVAARLTPIFCFDLAVYTAMMQWQANMLTDDNTHPIGDPSDPPAQLALAPGFFRDAHGDCRPHDLAALRAAAAAAAAASAEGVNFRWVREGDR